MSEKPYAYSVSATIDAPILAVFNILNDLGQMNSWSPFKAMDPNMVSVISDPSKGVGSRFSWDGKRIGKGSMTNIEVVKPSKVAFEMEFNNRKTEKALSEFLLSEVEGGTQVTWAMSGERGFGGWFMGKVLGLDSMMKKNFADGLGSLKRNIETAKK